MLSLSDRVIRHNPDGIIKLDPESIATFKRIRQTEKVRKFLQSRPKILKLLEKEEERLRQEQEQQHRKRATRPSEQRLLLLKDQEELEKSDSTSDIRHMKAHALQVLNEAAITAAIAKQPPSFTPKRLLYMNRGLIHLLEIIDQSPESQISTRKLLEAINSGDLHRLIKKAEELGFIKREKVKKPKGQKGNNMVVNSLTEEGRVLLGLADEFFGRH